MDIITSDTFGNPVKLIPQKIHSVLHQPCEGSAHVYAHYPKMVVISRLKEKNIWSIIVEELWDDNPDKMKLTSVYCVHFKDEEIDAAIELFLSLIKSPRKDFVQYMHKKLGRWIIIPRLEITNISDVQSYLYEKLREDIRNNSGRRRLRSTTRKAKACG
jgi:hypothetical protein